MALKGDIKEKEPKKKRGMRSKRDRKVDIISKMPNCILLYIMTFLTTKEAVQTCTLSKRWKDLWKYLPTLIANNTHFRKAEFFKKFVCKVLLHRDDSSALHNVTIEHNGYVHSQILDKLIKYVVSHNVEQFKIDAYICGYDPKDIVFSRSMFSCHSLKSLDLSLCGFRGKAILPKTLDFPELIDCRLKDVAFSSSYDGYAQPFSGCKKLSTLVINSCTLHNAEVLRVFGDKLINLTIWFDIFTNPCKVQISTPYLNSFTYVGRLTTSNRQLFEHNLNFLNEVRIEAWSGGFFPEIAKTLKSWLKRFTNVNSMTVSSTALEVLSMIPDLSNNEPVGFSNLMTLNVKHEPGSPILAAGLDYLLHDSPSAKVTITEAMPSYYDEVEFVFNSTLGAFLMMSKKVKSRRRS